MSRVCFVAYTFAAVSFSVLIKDTAHIDFNLQTNLFLAH